MPLQTPSACTVAGCAGRAVERGRCRHHIATQAERGYGVKRGPFNQQEARAALARTIPAPCAYCGVTVTRSERWVAAHVHDRDSFSARVVAHPGCNEGAKGGRLTPTYIRSPKSRTERHVAPAGSP